MTLFDIFAAEAATDPDVASDDRATFDAWLATDPAPAEDLPHAA